MIDSKRESVTFTCKEDVWNVIDLLIEEVHENNQKGKEFDVAQSINAQLPFFSCKNIVFDKDIQRDIERYLYCSETNVPPYEGSYDEQPALWVERYFTMKAAFAKKERSMINKAKEKK